MLFMQVSETSFYHFYVYEFKASVTKISDKIKQTNKVFGKSQNTSISEINVNSIPAKCKCLKRAFFKLLLYSGRFHPCLLIFEKC